MSEDNSQVLPVTSDAMPMRRRTFLKKASQTAFTMTLVDLVIAPRAEGLSTPTPDCNNYTGGDSLCFTGADPGTVYKADNNCYTIASGNGDQDGACGAISGADPQARAVYDEDESCASISPQVEDKKDQSCGKRIPGPGGTFTAKSIDEYCRQKLLGKEGDAYMQ